MEIVLIVGALVPLLALAATIWAHRRAGHRLLRGVVYGILGANTLFLVLLGFALLSLLSHGLSPSAGASPSAQQVDASAAQFGYLAAALSVGLACIGAGIAVAATGSAALGSIAERPELFGRTLVYVGPAEGVAIYGLIVSILILGQI